MAAPTLDELADWVGGDQPPAPSASRTARLTAALASATEQIEGRCLAQYVDDEHDDFTSYPSSIHTAILMLANRLFARADAPSGVAGFDGQGDALFPRLDADVEKLVARYLDLAGFS